MPLDERQKILTAKQQMILYRSQPSIHCMNITLATVQCLQCTGGRLCFHHHVTILYNPLCLGHYTKLTLCPTTVL